MGNATKVTGSGVTGSTSSSVAILADQTPYDAVGKNPSSSTPAPVDTTTSGYSVDNRKKQTSQNHTSGEFMNVLFADSHVSDAKGPNVGVEDDHIYGCSGDTDPDKGGTATTAIVTSHQTDKDSYLFGPVD
jgi:prepilin-type processing-associated H-X9-DG protein